MDPGPVATGRASAADAAAGTAAPTERDLAALARLAAAGIHDASVQPFQVAWTDASPAERARSVLQYQWRQWGAWTPGNWSLELAVACEGTVVGIQAISGRDFAITREAVTGSWLGQAHQGRGIGTEMRAAVLHLSFAGLHARYAVSSAFADNAASLAVSRKLGYADDGIELHVRRGQPTTMRRLRLDRATWLGNHTVPVAIEGLEPCLPLFGLAEAAEADV